MVLIETFELVIFRDEKIKVNYVALVVIVKRSKGPLQRPLLSLLCDIKSFSRHKRDGLNSAIYCSSERKKSRSGKLSMVC